MIYILQFLCLNGLIMILIFIIEHKLFMNIEIYFVLKIDYFSNVAYYLQRDEDINCYSQLHIPKILLKCKN